MINLVSIKRDGLEILVNFREVEILREAAAKHRRRNDSEMFRAVACVKRIFPKSEIVAVNVSGNSQNSLPDRRSLIFEKKNTMGEGASPKPVKTKRRQFSMFEKETETGRK